MRETSTTHQLNNNDRITRRMVVKGLENRSNEALISLVTKNKATSTVIFFPGDVQDFEANMLMGPHSSLVSYSYEKICTTLLQRFGPLTNILIIRPQSLALETYATFCNFVDCNEHGAVTSTYSPNGITIRHLKALLDSVELAYTRRQIVFGPLHLIGFSKGGIVLNQLITEAAHNNQYHDFVSRLSSIHWLDSGNGSSPGAVPNDPSTLNAFSSSITHPLKLYVHVTPYQYDAIDRPWIRIEIEKWIEAVRKSATSTIQLIRYYAYEPATLLTHFQIIQDMQILVSIEKEPQLSTSFEVQPVPLLSTTHHGQ